jgi:hypothetical protein
MSSPEKELHKVTFIPKQSAHFFCPPSELDSFVEFLHSEHIEGIHCDGTSADTDRIIIVEVSDVDLTESEKLQSKFNQRLARSKNA